ncbi:hypothetical protein L6164_017099 [Bauhinia variegata]|uniref:Uncharacterized protein n=1 Tax=Bauhinia variegata TaxID=167791 RepID=A0ACB9N714_BAUVA|nr:hypothetical protein L6164_017099 [Bauhinia variegata]
MKFLKYLGRCLRLEKELRLHFPLPHLFSCFAGYSLNFPSQVVSLERAWTISWSKEESRSCEGKETPGL